MVSNKTEKIPGLKSNPPPPPTKKISHAEFSRLETPKNVLCFINNIMQSDIRLF